MSEEFAQGKNGGRSNAGRREPNTPIGRGPFSASAGKGGSKESNPFHGYYFRVVGVSGPGKTRRGLKLIAYPAGYQSSGVKTFVVTQRGIVFEKDLGPETPTVAPQMKARTGPSWHTTE